MFKKYEKGFIVHQISLDFVEFAVREEGILGISCRFETGVTGRWFQEESTALKERSCETDRTEVHCTVMGWMAWMEECDLE